MVTNELVVDDSGYTIDFEALRACIDADTEALMFCNPQNPTGRVFRRQELEQLAALAIEADLVIISDEIHADLVFAPHQHVPLATLGPEVEARTVTLSSATKAFNIAGLRCSVAAFGSADLQERFGSLSRHILGGLGSLGTSAAELAWTRCQPWLDDVLHYISGNLDLLEQFLAAELPEVRYSRPEGTYLAWLDCRELGLPHEPYEFFLEEARVALESGRELRSGRGRLRPTELRHVEEPPHRGTRTHGESRARAHALGARDILTCESEEACMKIKVDYDLCEANAICMQQAPEVFRVDEDDNLDVLQEESGTGASREGRERGAALPPPGARDRRLLIG